MRFATGMPVLFLSLLAPFGVMAASGSPSSGENGAVTFYTGSGWSFGFPSVQAVAGPVTSPLKKTLPAYNAGVAVRAWRYLVPFADFSAIDTGKAFAQYGSNSTTVQADTFSLNGGLRIIGHSSRLRPFAEVGGGFLRQNATASFSSGGQTSPVAFSGSTYTVMYGGGVQVFIGKKWGTQIAYDEFRTGVPLNGAGQNYGTMRIGFFYQTKSSVE